MGRASWPDIPDPPNINPATLADFNEQLLQLDFAALVRKDLLHVLDQLAFSAAAFGIQWSIVPDYTASLIADRRRLSARELF